jgi:hypothetical protein
LSYTKKKNQFNWNVHPISLYKFGLFTRYKNSSLKTDQRLGAILPIPIFGAIIESASSKAINIFTPCRKK